MELNKKMCFVIADLEYEIGLNCYNPNSYDGWNDVEGCEFRYPINIRNQNDEFVKVRSNINNSTLIDKDEITSEAIKYMKYKLGANELFIGLGIINVLKYLENRYNLDFNELENNL